MRYHIRDWLGRRVVSTTRNLGSCSPLLAELWGVLLGLHLAWESGHRSLILETDSQMVVQLVSDIYLLQ